MRGVSEKNGVIGAICHAAWVPISAHVVVKARTCVAAIKDDLINAGADYVDEAVVVDGNLVTSHAGGPAGLAAGADQGDCRRIIDAEAAGRA